MIKLKNNFLINYSVTFVSQIIILISQILLLQILSHQIPEEGLGIYMVIRRLVALSFPVITLNLSVGMQRYINFDKDKADKYLLYSFIILNFVILLLLISLPFCKNLLSEWVFGNEKYALLMLPTLIFLYSNSFQILCVGYFCGKQNFLMMNLVNVIFGLFSLLTLLTLLFISSNFIAFIYIYLTAYAIIALIVNLSLIIKEESFRSNLKSIFKNGINFHFFQSEKKFIRYGYSRIPSGFFLGAIFFIPIFAASNSLSLTHAAYIGLIVSIVRMLQITGTPLNLILLPKFSHFQSKGLQKEIYNYSKIVIEFILTIPFLVGVFLAFLAPEIITLWFGNKYAIIIPYIELLGLTIGFFIGYVLIRGILDGLMDYPYANVITFISMVLVSIFSGLTIWFSWDLLGLTIAFGIGLITLGSCSFYILIDKQTIGIINSRNILAVVWFLSLFSLVHLYNNTIIIEPLLLSFFIKVLISILLLLISLLIYYLLNFSWIREINMNLNKIFLEK